MLARTSGRFRVRFGTAMLIASGVAPDLDYTSYFGGAAAFLRFHRTLLHSLPGAAVLACAIAGSFCVLDRKRRRKTPEAKPVASLTFAAAFGICAAGAGGHILLDLASGEGMQLLWPFRVHWTAWSLLANFDPLLLALLAAGLLIPALFRLVNEEVGARRNGGAGAAAFTLLLIAAYVGTRAELHGRAVGLLLSREYGGREPLAAGAFPSATRPLEWRGVVATDNTMEELTVSLGRGTDFNPDRSLTRYKPEGSPALDAGERTASAQRFLKYAEFPLASVSQREDGYRFELRDARFPEGDTSPANIVVRVDLDAGFNILREDCRYASSHEP